MVPPGGQAATGVFNGHQLFVSVPIGGNHSSDWDIAVSEYDAANDTFGPAVVIPELRSPAEDYPTWVSPDGNRLIFGSNRAEGYGSYDLYSAERDGTNWSYANLGPEINTADKEMHGSIAEEAGLFFFERRSLSQGEISLMQATVTPEPSILVLLAVGVIGLLGLAWRRRKRAA